MTHPLKTHGQVCIALTLLSGCTTALSPEYALATDRFVHDQYGRIVIDVSVNGRSAQPFVVDTAASISAIYAPCQTPLGLQPTGRSTLVHGLTA